MESFPVYHFIAGASCLFIAFYARHAAISLRKAAFYLKDISAFLKRPEKVKTVDKKKRK